MKGVVFDIEQMTVHDGPGIRTTVFLKGCPLRCVWCHNPEGLSPKPQLMTSDSGCLHCGRCRRVCPSPERCIACGKCVEVCPLNLRRICGRTMDSGELAALLLRDRGYLRSVGGGVTFSGGEPTFQGAFLLETLEKLPDLHCAIETCGQCNGELFSALVERLDYIIMDIKFADSRLHRRYTGAGNEKILQNLADLKQQRKPFLIRIPVIPGVNDTEENFERTAQLLCGAPSLEGVELLAYHQTAGAKYSMLGRHYAPPFDPARKPNCDPDAFTRRGIPCCVRT
jgi:pyruvate formate lyase activating enzyme